MSNARQRYDRVAQSVNRRRVIAGMGTLAAGGVAVAAVPDAARATVEVDDLSIPDASFEAEAVDPEVVVDVAYAYDASGAGVDALGFTLTVGETVVDEARLDTNTEELENTETLRGSVTDSDAWSASDFEPEVGDSVTRELSIGVTFDVLDSADESVVGDTATETADVTVEHPQENGYSASVDGEGEIVTDD
ncbi:MAG: hypothetical protein ACOCQM_05905 [Natronomonas sp.]